MRHFDLAIAGYGILPCLLAIHWLDRDPGRSILLLAGDDTIGGERLEPACVSSLSPTALALVEPFIVQRWPGYLITNDGTTISRDDEVLLLDPVQVWLELQGLLGPEHMISKIQHFSRDDCQLSWIDGSAGTSDLLDLRGITRHEQSEEIIGLESVRSLPWPVLADFDTGDEPWDAFQHIPLGDDRVYVRKCKCRGDPEIELTTGFGRLLSDLTAF